MPTDVSDPALDSVASDPELGSENVAQIVSFRLGDEEYGVDIMCVQEVILIGQVTLMPQVPEHVCGLINLRGHVIPVLDLRVRFELPTTEATEQSRIIILNVDEKTIGIIVDEVNEVLRIKTDTIDAAPLGSTGLSEQYVKGLVKFESKLLILLNVEHIVEQETAQPTSARGT